MSDSPRMPRAWGVSAAATLMKAWGMIEPECLVVGSIRRGAAEVGDLDIIAPACDDKKHDHLHQRIDATCLRTGDLFGGAGEQFAEELEGLKPGFAACKLLAQLQGIGPGAEPVKIPVQVFRYHPDNRGWIEIMRTGPGEFGKWFLWRWKLRFQIQEGKPASVDGRLVDCFGRVVPTHGERGAFEALGQPYVEPADRAAFVAREWARHSKSQEEQFR